MFALKKLQRKIMSFRNNWIAEKELNKAGIKLWLDDLKVGKLTKMAVNWSTLEPTL